ncbi:porin [Paraglaciecola aquimarina]|uniref:Porin n=1 Tax=Paraglaciecola aquimarina TaxID=1235557 RepID=A0ABU3SVU7_9ALTE|nr:porin [Paraglaciecola aquimarina]MDU0354145.1 porin [Paraglaciecola aquimarina]
MKQFTKLTPVAATLMLALSTTAVQADDKLSVGGFIDMSYLAVDTDGGASTHNSGVDQVEVNLGYDFGNKLTATVDVEYKNSNDGANVEQAFISYAVSDNLSIKAGRFLSYSGWETEEPTGLFQYSGTGYAQYFYGYYQQGVSALYSSDKFAVAVSVVNDLAGPQSTDSEHPGVETMVAFMPTENFTVKGFYSVDGDTKMLNTWAAYSKDSLTLAAEYNSSEDTAGAGSEADGYLLMANYGFANGLGLTLRYHDYSIDDATGNTFEDMSAITISPSYTVNSNLLMVFEYRMDSDDIGGMDSDSIAIEALVTF